MNPADLTGGALSERCIVLAPTGRDAPIAAAMLKEAGIDSAIVVDVPGLATELHVGAGFALITDESLRSADVRLLADFLSDQEEWSDFPFVLLTVRGGSIERNPAAQRYLELLGNVTFIERPFHPTTLVSIAKAALRARRRQYDARARLLAVRSAQEQLTLALAAGGLGSWSLEIPTMDFVASADSKAHFGRRPDDPFAYTDLAESIHPDDRARMQAAVASSLEVGNDYDIEYRCVWPDGSIHWLHVAGRPEHDPAGRPLRMSGVCQDITDRRKAEETLRNFALEMERQVEERTREREAISAQLHEAQKLETIGQLTGGVAHDFNNLLTPIVGILDLLQRRSDDERTLRLLDGALQAAERARTLISRLLSFARRQNLEARPVDAGALVEGMVDLVRRSIGPTIELKIDIAPGLPAAMVDPNQLELALLNLAVNARDAMPDGGRLWISVDQNELAADGGSMQRGPYVVLRITDSGQGMDAETLARAVEPFYSTKGVGRGTGLGLSMVHGLAAQSGGGLILTSEPGAGTKAELWLPAVASTILQPSAPAAEAPETGRKLRILVVDDEELVRTGTVEMLHDLGHEVVPVGSGAAALIKIRSERFDLVVTDYLMPGMSGLELVREAGRIMPELPFLMITAFADLADETAGDIVRLAKPYRLADLARAVEQSVRACGCPVR